MAWRAKAARSNDFVAGLVDDPVRAEVEHVLGLEEDRHHDRRAEASSSR